MVLVEFFLYSGYHSDGETLSMKGVWAQLLEALGMGGLQLSVPSAIALAVKVSSPTAMGMIVPGKDRGMNTALNLQKLGGHSCTNEWH